MSWPSFAAGAQTPGPMNLWSKVGSGAAPLESLAGAIAANTLIGAGSNDIVIPYESLYPGWRAKIDCYIEHSGTAGAVSNAMLKAAVGARSANGTTINVLNPGAADGTGAHLGAYLFWDGSQIWCPLNSADITAITTRNAFTLTAGQVLTIAPAVTTVAAGDSVKLLAISLDRLY